MKAVPNCINIDDLIPNINIKKFMFFDQPVSGDTRWRASVRWHWEMCKCQRWHWVTCMCQRWHWVHYSKILAEWPVYRSVNYLTLMIYLTFFSEPSPLLFPLPPFPSHSPLTPRPFLPLTLPLPPSPSIPTVSWVAATYGNIIKWVA